MRVILLFCVIGLLSGCAATMRISPEDAVYQKIIELPNQSKSAIYEKSRQWFAERFKSARSIIEYENKDEGAIIGNSAMPRPVSVVHIGGGSTISYTMKEEIKDNRVRLTFNNFVAFAPTSVNNITGQVYSGGEMPVLQADLEGLRANLDLLADDLRTYILNKNAESW